MRKKTWAKRRKNQTKRKTRIEQESKGDLTCKEVSEEVKKSIDIFVIFFVHF